MGIKCKFMKWFTPRKWFFNKLIKEISWLLPILGKTNWPKDVKTQDYKLTPGIYVGTEEEENDGMLLEEKIAGLKDET